MSPTPVRAILIRIEQDRLFKYFSGEATLCNIPAEAALTAIWLEGGKWIEDRRTRVLVMRLEHPSFAEIAPGTRIPVVTARFRRLPK